MLGSGDQHGQSSRPSLRRIAQEEGDEGGPSDGHGSGDAYGAGDDAQEEREELSEKMLGSDDQHGQLRVPFLRGIAEDKGGEDAASDRKSKRPKGSGNIPLARFYFGNECTPSILFVLRKIYGFDIFFYEAVRRGDLIVVEKMLERNSELLNKKFTSLEKNALQVAVVARQEEIVRHLLDRKHDPEFLKTRNDYGDTALTLAAATGSKAIVKLLVEKYEDLVNIMNARGQLAVVVAAFCGHEETVRYLYEFTLVETLYVSKEEKKGRDLYDFILVESLHPLQKEEAVGDADTKFQGYYSDNNGFMLFKACITAEIYDIALDAFMEGPKQCIEEIQKEKGETLYSLALADFGTARINGFLPWLYHNVSSLQSGFVKKYRSHHGLASKLLREICKELSSSNLYDIRSILGNPTFTAVLEENEDFVKIVFEECPDVIWLEFEGFPIFSHAISKGIEKIYTFVCKRTEINLLRAVIADRNGNTLLHHAAKLSPSPQLSHLLGPALQMQRELQRFKEVEKMIPMFKKSRNNRKQTPEDLFNKKHKKLKTEAQAWLKEIAQSCSLVATLIVTIMFTAAFTVPGGESDDTGIPRKLGSKYFTIYIISDAVSLLFSCTSAMIFLGIHTSLFREDDFRIKLPLALMFGLLTLFLSIATMMIAFGVALFIMLQEHFMWISISILILGSIPVSIYAILHVRIFIHVFRSTFGSPAKWFAIALRVCRKTK